MKSTKTGKGSSRPDLFATPHSADPNPTISVLSSLNEKPAKKKKRSTQRPWLIPAVVATCAGIAVLVGVYWFIGQQEKSTVATFPPVPVHVAGEPPTNPIIRQPVAGNSVPVSAIISAPAHVETEQASNSAEEKPKAEAQPAPSVAAAPSHSPLKTLVTAPTKPKADVRNTAAKKADATQNDKSADTDVILLEALLTHIKGATGSATPPKAKEAAP